MFNNDYTTSTERQIVGTLIAAAIRQGYCISINDGAEWTVSRSRDAEQITSELATTGYDTLKIRAGDTVIGRVFTVWGNDGDVIADHTDNDLTAALVAEAIRANEAAQ